MVEKISSKIYVDEISVMDRFPLTYFFGKLSDTGTEPIIKKYKLAGAATDEAITVDTIPNTVAVFFLDLDNTNELSVKINGESSSNTVHPMFCITDTQVTALTVTNADATNANWLTVVTFKTED